MPDRPSPTGRGVADRVVASARYRWARRVRRVRRGLFGLRLAIRIHLLPITDRVARRRVIVGSPANAGTSIPSAVVLCVYRRRNAAVVRRLARQSEAAGARLALWALDEGHDDLVGYHVGAGAGLRAELVSELYRRVAPRPEDRVVIADDDAEFTSGTLSELLTIVDSAGLGIAQAAHEPRSHWSLRLTIGRVGSVVRRTGFVEIGPVVVFSPPWVDKVLPFPEGFGMGWGLEVGWSRLQDEGCRLGIVDVVRVTHLTPPATEYARSVETERVTELVGSSDMATFIEAHGTREVWRPWRTAPPWHS